MESIGMLRVKSERTLDVDDKLCKCFIDGQNVLVHVNWTKLMWILKENVIYRCGRRLISKLYVDDSVKIRLDEGEIRSMKIGRGVRQGSCLSQILFSVYSECLIKEAVEGFGDFKIEGHVICAVKYADDLVQPSKEEALLQGTTDRLHEIVTFFLVILKECKKQEW
jgi:hypothetical protein